jgi:hypothetical protein
VVIADAFTTTPRDEDQEGVSVTAKATTISERRRVRGTRAPTLDEDWRRAGACTPVASTAMRTVAAVLTATVLATGCYKTSSIKPTELPTLTGPTTGVTDMAVTLVATIATSAAILAAF